MPTIARGITYTDLNFLGQPRVIATAVLEDAGGAALVDPGPSTCLDTLRCVAPRAGHRAGRRADDSPHPHPPRPRRRHWHPRAREPRHPGLRARGGGVAHGRPGQAAAQRGPALWRRHGPVVGRVPARARGERARPRRRRAPRGGRPASWRSLYTPGHASHHVSFLDRASGVAFVGDTAGVRVGPERFVLPPTPPPDIDLDVWKESLRRIAEWQADTLFVTHFGPHEDAADQLAGMSRASRRAGRPRARHHRGGRPRRGARGPLRRRHPPLPDASHARGAGGALRHGRPVLDVLARARALLEEAGPRRELTAAVGQADSR